MFTLQMSLDLSQFERRLENIAKHERTAIASALTTTARAARKAFTASVTPDAVGPAKSSFRSALRAQVGNVRSATPMSLTAVQIFRPSRFGVSPLLRSLTPGNQHKPGGANVGTFMVTGGGSASLSSPKFFMIRASGGQVILESRPGVKRHGRKLTRSEVKRIYAEQPLTAFRQETSVPRRAWDNAINSSLAFAVAANLQRVFDGNSAPAPTGSEGE